MSEKVNVKEGTPLTKEDFIIEMDAVKKDFSGNIVKIFEWLKESQFEWHKDQQRQDKEIEKLKRESKSYRSKRDIIILSIASCAGVFLLVLLIFEKFIK
jgi:hypothetical protein